MELASIVSCHADSKRSTGHERIVSFTPQGNQIKTTQEIMITHEPNVGYLESGRRGSETEVTGNYQKDDVKVPSVIVEEISRNGTPRSKSLDSATDGVDSVRSGGVKTGEDSDDEVALVWMDRRRGKD